MLTTSAASLADATALRDWIVEIRRDLHRHPELGYEETRTSGVVRRTLEALGIPCAQGIAGTGVVGTIGTGRGPCIALRADMDALPIHEEADVPFRSVIDGRMHACGHDCHTAMLLGAARILKERESDLHGTVKLLFQPAEEGGAGARRMCEEGALAAPDVERIFGLHVWPWLPTGAVGGRPGPLLGACAQLCIEVAGVGGHGATPHFTNDAVLTASKIVVELQSIVAREVNPLDAAVVSVTSVHGGDAFNVIPPHVVLRGTLRALTLPVLHFLKERISRIATLVAEANRCHADVTFPGDECPPTHNDPALWHLAIDCARTVLGVDAVVEVPPTLGSEDFAYYVERIPGSFMLLGTRNEPIGAVHSVHHPQFLVDEAALPIGTVLHVEFARAALRPPAARG